MWFIVEELSKSFPMRCVGMMKFLLSAIGRGKENCSQECLALGDSGSRIRAAGEPQNSFKTLRPFFGEGFTIPQGQECAILERKTNDQYGMNIWTPALNTSDPAQVRLQLLAHRLQNCRSFVNFPAFLTILSWQIRLLSIAALGKTGELSSPDNEAEPFQENPSFNIRELLLTLHHCFEIALRVESEASLEIAEAVLRCFSSIYSVDYNRKEFLQMVCETDRLEKLLFSSRDMKRRFSECGIIQNSSIIISGLKLLLRVDQYLNSQKTNSQPGIALGSPYVVPCSSLSRACLQLGISLLSDFSLGSRFDSVEVTHFVSDFLQLLLIDIIPSFDSVNLNVEVLSYTRTLYLILLLVSLILERFQASSETMQFDILLPSQQPFMNLLADLLNKRRIFSLLMMVITPKMYIQGQGASIKIDNRLFKELGARMGTEGKQEFLLCIATALRCIHQVMTMAYNVQVNKLTASAGKPTAVDYASQLIIVSEIYSAFYGSEMFYFPVDTTRQVGRIPINLILCFASYLTFEKEADISAYDQILIHDQDGKVCGFRSSFENDGVLCGGYIPKQLLYAGINTPIRIAESIALEATICLTKSIMLWELLPPMSRPSILSYIDYSKISMFSFEDSLNFTLNCREKLRDSILEILIAYSYIPKISTAMLELLILASYSQRTFFEFILRADKVWASLSRDLHAKNPL